MKALTQWPRLLGHILRRDRIYLPTWIIAVVVFSIFFVPLIEQLAGTPEEFSTLATMMENPAIVAICGIMYGETYTLAIMYTQMMLVFCALVAAVMNVLIVIRHTRGDEDEGRLEVIRSLPVGRLTNLAAVSVLMIAINLIVALLVGFGMASFQMETFDLAGCMLYGAAIGACGLAFAGLTMVIVQCVHSTRGALGWSMGLLGGFYLLRAYGDVSSEAAAMVSPLGLVQRSYPFDTDQWGPVIVAAVIGLALIVAAFPLNSMRDLGAGLLPERRGKHAHASRFLSDEWGLAWRLTRGTIIAWVIIAFVLAASYASVMGDMEGFINSSDLYQQLLGVGADTEDIVGPVVSMLMLVTSMFAGIGLLLVAFKLSSEERKGRLDYLIGKTVSKTRLFIGYALLVGLTAILMQFVLIFGFWGVAGSVMDEPLSLTMVATVGFNHLAALIGLGGVALFLVGWAKKATGVGWAYLIASFLIVYMGGMLDLPSWVGQLTPYGIPSRYPVDPFSWAAWIGLVLGGIVLAGLGAIGYRRRDIIN